MSPFLYQTAKLIFSGLGENRHGGVTRHLPVILRLYVHTPVCATILTCNLQGLHIYERLSEHKLTVCFYLLSDLVQP